MSNPFVGEIKMVGFTFAPKGWAFCDGQLLPISQNSALFALLGTTFGGNGITTFQLPNLQGRAPMGAGQGPGLPNYNLGEMTGTETVSLLVSQLPSHNHAASASSFQGDSPNPSGRVWATSSATQVPKYTAAAAANGDMATTALSNTGSNQPHNNMQPFLVINYCIALDGIFPSRN